MTFNEVYWLDKLERQYKLGISAIKKAVADREKECWKEELEFLEGWYAVCQYKSSFKDYKIEERIEILKSKLHSQKTTQTFKLEREDALNVKPIIACGSQKVKTSDTIHKGCRKTDKNISLLSCGEWLDGKQFLCSKCKSKQKVER